MGEEMTPNEALMRWVSKMTDNERNDFIDAATLDAHIAAQPKDWMSEEITQPRTKPISGLAAQVIDQTPHGVNRDDFIAAAKEIRDAVKMDDAVLLRDLLHMNYHVIMAALDKAGSK